MSEFDWMRSRKDKKETPEEESATVVQPEQKPPEPGPEDKAESPTVIEIEGDTFDPIERLAVLALVDVAPKAKKLRGVPLLFHLKRPVTVIGTGKRAHVKVDDPETIKGEHAAIAFKEGAFRIYSQEGAVSVDGKQVLEDGEGLRHGSAVEMGSARFVFLCVGAPTDQA